jgi:hypothetical protein
MMLGLASWPLMILGALLLIAVLFVMVILLNDFFRHKEAM